MNKDKLRQEAHRLLEKSMNWLTMRSCWKCNPAHEHLKKSPFVITCLECGHYYYKGVDITE